MGAGAGAVGSATGPSLGAGAAGAGAGTGAGAAAGFAGGAADAAEHSTALNKTARTGCLKFITDLSLLAQQFADLIEKDTLITALEAHR